MEQPLAQFGMCETGVDKNKVFSLFQCFIKADMVLFNYRSPYETSPYAHQKQLFLYVFWDPQWL